MSLLPPPAQAYSTREELLSSTRQWAAEHGYALTIKRSYPQKVYLKCDQGGEYRNKSNLTDDDRQRKTGSRLSGCPCSITGTERHGRWWLDVLDPNHNHEASETTAAHPSLRRLNTNEKEQVSELTRAGVNPRTIVAVLRAERTTPVTVKDIYNARLIGRIETLAGKTPIQALVHELQEKHFVWHVRTGSGGHVTHLFFVTKNGLSLYEAYPEVILLDCTYKTNRFKMPLMVMVGITGLNTSFYLGFVFLQTETEESYTWALERLRDSVSTGPGVAVTDRDLALMSSLRTVFPSTRNLLCRWHIQKNILAKCRSHFPAAEPDSDNDEWTRFLQAWSTVLKTRTPEAFEEEWIKMKRKFRARIYPCRYIETVWMPWKERFAAPWSNNVMHLGTVVTSRVESAHACLKRYLETSTGDLHRVYERILQLVNAQFAEYQAEVAKQKARKPHKANRALYAPLIGLVSTSALHKMVEQHENSQAPSFALECSGTFQRIMGLPCGHVLRDRAQSGLGILPSAVHRHWYFDPQRQVSSGTTLLDPQLLNPLPSRPRGRPPQSTSTRRNSSQFERVEQESSVTSTLESTGDILIIARPDVDNEMTNMQASEETLRVREQQDGRSNQPRKRGGRGRVRGGVSRTQNTPRGGIAKSRSRIITRSQVRVQRHAA